MKDGAVSSQNEPGWLDKNDEGLTLAITVAVQTELLLFLPNTSQSKLQMALLSQLRIMDTALANRRIWTGLKHHSLTFQAKGSL